MDILKLIEQYPFKESESKAAWARRVAPLVGWKPESLRVQFNRQRRKSEHKALYDDALKKGYNADKVGNYWHKGKHISAHVKTDVISYDEIRYDLIRELSEYSPKFDTYRYEKKENPHLLVIDPADVHIGKLSNEYGTGDEYNSDIAVKRVVEGVLGILQKAKGFDIDQILFVAGNDILHTDNTKKSTTNGTLQDVDGMWYDNFLIAKDIYIRVMELLIAHAPVHFVFNPSNHDYQSGFFLSDVIYTYFRNHKNVTFDVGIKHRKYYRYFDNLIGTTHGDGAKRDALPNLMAVESNHWSECKHRYIYTHHIHHKDAKDFPGVTVESVRSPSGTDTWHHIKGYQHAPKAIEGYLHHPKHGQVARLTHLF